MSSLLSTKSLKAEIAGKQILKELNLEIKAGEIHVIMGPNGSGKSTLTKVFSGHPEVESKEGQVKFESEDVFELEPEEIANKGLFVAFQNPVEIPGLSLVHFLKTALNSKRKNNGLEELSSGDFLKLIREKVDFLNLKKDFYTRNVNEGLSGGEKKQAEILQLAVLDPKMIILDEIDSGLDVDSLKNVANNINKIFKDNPKEKAILMITHYQRILNYIKPDFVHIMLDGEIVKSGGFELVKKVEDEGYESFRK